MIQRLPKPLIDAYEWQDQGLCRRLPTEMFFGMELSRGGTRILHEERAKSVCRRCPVIDACLRHAMAAEAYGIWGGTTAQERADLRDGRVTMQCAT